MKNEKVKMEMKKHFDELGFDMSDDELDEHVEAKMFQDKLEAMGIELNETRLREEMEKERVPPLPLTSSVRHL